MSQAGQVETELRAQRAVAAAHNVIPPHRVQSETAQISALQRSLTSLETGTAQSVPRRGGSGHGTATQPQLRIPPTYIAPLRTSIASLASDYRQAVQTGNFTRPIADAASTVSEAGELHQSVSTTPVLLLDAQTWADAHHIDVNVQKSAGQAVKKVTNQAMSILNSTAAILTATGSLLVDVVLILLISLYFVSDGARMIQRGLEIVPDRYRKDATFFVHSVDTVLGQSIRSNLASAALAGLLGGAGALALGVPYAVLIAVSTFLLQLVPIIGALVLFIPPVVIALLFTTPTKAIILLAWYIIFEQIVTNVIGPRLTSKTVGIHPLEAMAAALVGYPLAGFLGSFLAVPVVGLTHVLAKEAYASWKARGSTAATSSESVEATRDESVAPAHDRVPPSTPLYAATRVDQ